MKRITQQNKETEEQKEDMCNIRKHELFAEIELIHKNIVTSVPLKMYPQERDWTCSIGCIRTILSGLIENVPSENSIIDMYAMTPRPYYSSDIKKVNILDEYDVIYGCDYSKVNFDDILEICLKGYYIMLECMVNYSHWLVLLGYYPLSTGKVEESKLLFFDPYYNEIKLINTDEFISMWVDGDFKNSNVKNDFVAIK